MVSQRHRKRKLLALAVIILTCIREMLSFKDKFPPPPPPLILTKFLLLPSAQLAGTKGACI